jgi:hypothetical protein
MQHLSISAPARYRITLNGSLDQSWSSRVGMKVNVKLDDERHPITTLTGEVLDQAMLLSVLNYVYDLGMPIILVERMDSEDA